MLELILPVRFTLQVQGLCRSEYSGVVEDSLKSSQVCGDWDKL